MCIAQHLKVKYNIAKDALQRLDEKSVELWGPRGESENWLLLQVNQCYSTEAHVVS